MQKIIIISAPSGSGKTTIVQQLIQNNPLLSFSVSATTRQKRAYEIEGKDYYFLSAEEFKQKLSEQAFAEHEEVYENLFYGTLKSEIERIWTNGQAVIADVDVKGGLKLKNLYQEKALAIFIKVPSLEVLETRLRNRNTETEASLQKRLAKFREELEFENQFDITVLNDDLNTAILTTQQIVSEFLEKV